MGSATRICSRAQVFCARWWRERKKRPVRFKVGLIAAFIVLASALSVGAAIAGTWGQTYVPNNTVWAPGSLATSEFNTSILSNEVDFSHPYGGDPKLGTTYVNSGGTEYTYDWWSAGAYADPRTGYSYGAARCKSSAQNNYYVAITYCYAYN